MENNFQGKEGQTVPEMTPEVVANITNRYIELYEHITGTKFEKADSTNILARIENNVISYPLQLPLCKGELEGVVV